MKFVIYDESGDISRFGVCSQTRYEKLRAKYVHVLLVSTLSRKMDMMKKVVDGKIVNKTPEEIEIDNYPELASVPILVPYEEQIANITNGQLQSILTRLDNLESK